MLLVIDVRHVCRSTNLLVGDNRQLLEFNRNFGSASRPSASGRVFFVGRNLWICAIHGSCCAICGSLVRAGIHGSRSRRVVASAICRSNTVSVNTEIHRNAPKSTEIHHKASIYLPKYTHTSIVMV